MGQQIGEDYYKVEQKKPNIEFDVDEHSDDKYNTRNRYYFIKDGL